MARNEDGRCLTCDSRRACGCDDDRYDDDLPAVQTGAGLRAAARQDRQEAVDFHRIGMLVPAARERMLVLAEHRESRAALNEMAAAHLERLEGGLSVRT